MKSDFTYERLAQGEITWDLEADDRKRLAELDAQDKVFLERHPAPILPARPRSAQWPSLAVAAAVMVAIVGLGTTQLPDTRAKGAELSLLVYHKTATGTELLGPSNRLGRDDEVQLAYFSSGKHYAAILSVDGRGTITTHLPLNGGTSVEVATPKPELLPYSYRLDDAPDYETFYLIVRDEPFEVAQIRPFLHDTGADLRLPDGFTATEFRVAKKETSR